MIAPFDLKGIGALEYRYIDPAKQDDTWLYVPSLRRVRRLSTAQRSDAALRPGHRSRLATGATTVTSPGRNGSYLGEKDMLGILHGEKFPQKRCDRRGRLPDVRRVGEAPHVRSSKASRSFRSTPTGSACSSSTKDALVVAYSDIYDRNSELWKVWIDNHQFRTQAFPGAPNKYDEEKDFYAGLAMVDMQLMHATYVPHPATRRRATKAGTSTRARSRRPSTSRAARCRIRSRSRS